MTLPIVSPRLLAGMDGFFPFRATIQGVSAMADSYGQPVESRADVSGWQDIRAAKSPLSEMERQSAGYTTTDSVWNVLLKGAYPDITTRHQAVIDGETFDIDSVETDQTGTLTQLRVSKKTI